MYQTPRMMVPVRTWQHRQQLVEYQRSHGEIIILSDLSRLSAHLEATSLFVKDTDRAVLSASAERRCRLRNDDQDPTASDLSATYHRERLNGAERRASNSRRSINTTSCFKIKPR